MGNSRANNLVSIVAVGFNNEVPEFLNRKQAVNGKLPFMAIYRPRDRLDRMVDSRMLSAVTAALSGERGFRGRDKERDFITGRFTPATALELALIFSKELAFFKGDEPVSRAFARAPF